MPNAIAQDPRSVIAGVVAVVAVVGVTILVALDRDPAALVTIGTAALTYAVGLHSTPRSETDVRVLEPRDDEAFAVDDRAIADSVTVDEDGER